VWLWVIDVIGNARDVLRLTDPAFVAALESGIYLDRRQKEIARFGLPLTNRSGRSLRTERAYRCREMPSVARRSSPVRSSSLGRREIRAGRRLLRSEDKGS